MSKLEQRLLDKIVHSPDGCWEFTGNINNSGYGRIKINYRSYAAHRLAAHIYLGLDLENSSVMVCHHCDNKKCINPEHLYLGNHETNTKDAVERQRLPRGENVHNSKLTWKEVEEIRRFYRKKILSQRELAKLFKVSKNCIKSIVNNQTWKLSGHCPTK